MEKKNQWITGNTAGYYMGVNEHDLKQFRKDSKNKTAFRESKTSTTIHRMYEYKINILKEYFKTEKEIPDRLIRV